MRDWLTTIISIVLISTFAVFYFVVKFLRAHTETLRSNYHEKWTKITHIVMMTTLWKCRLKWNGVTTLAGQHHDGIQQQQQGFSSSQYFFLQ
jgi:hypothetical protein